MKRYEADTCASAVDASRYVVVRLDGHCFSTFTKGFDRPYDLRIHRAMVGTATDLLQRFRAVTAYTESDEISLFFPPHSEEHPSDIPFNGRVQKISSVFAGYASARFNMHMLREAFDEAIPLQAKLKERVECSEAHFDARVFSVPSLERLCAYMRWRALQDCRRNSIAMLAQKSFKPEEIHGVDAKGMLSMLRELKGIEWEETPPFFRYGTYVKREEYTKEGYNPKTQQTTIATRSRAVSRSFQFDEEAAATFLLARVWPVEGPGAGVAAGVGGEAAAASSSDVQTKMPSAE